MLYIYIYTCRIDLYVYSKSIILSRCYVIKNSHFKLLNDVFEQYDYLVLIHLNIDDSKRWKHLYKYNVLIYAPRRRKVQYAAE